MSWQQVNLGDYIYIKHGYAFKSQYFADDGKKVLLTPGNFLEKGGFRRRKDKDRYFVGEYPESFELSENDLIIAMTEQGPGLLGSSAWIPGEETYLHNQRLGLVSITKESVLDKKFLYFLFNTRDVRAQINASATGTKVRHTAPERIYKVKANIPDKPTQERIAATLTAYDDLIENNKRRIELLEESARQLYKEWFVRFRFPGHEHVKIIDGVPEGWEKKAISELSSFLSRGMTPKYDDEGKYIVINQKCIRNRVLSLDLVRRQSKDFKEEKLVQNGDILINSTGTGTLGRVAQCWIDIKDCTVDTHVTIVRPKTDISSYWFGYCLMELETIFEGMGEGATNQKELKRDLVGTLSVVTPAPSLQSEFHDIVSSSIKQITNLVEQNKNLIHARDLLLPKLMNGEIAV